MFAINGNAYYPMGDPQGDVPVVVNRYTDVDGIDFYICYTGAQQRQGQKYGLFKPFPVQKSWTGSKLVDVRPS